ncbi:hypothetical protein C0991_005575 [Blastosporella zonata]|nr:hypothetical protein C0991_005575 [Blastosporella zonata]
MSEPTLKRKQPPSFRHLPINRAKKLKQTWVENQKIKSKWKTQKRKEGLSTTPGEPQDEESAGGSEDEESIEDEEKAASEPEEHPPAPKSALQKPAPPKSTLHPSRSHIHPELAPQKKRRRLAEPDTPTEPLSREKAGEGKGVLVGADAGAREEVAVGIPEAGELIEERQAGVNPI